MLDRAATKLRETLAVRTTPQNNVRLRDDLVQAMAPLADPDAAFVYRDMLASKLESPHVRQSLLSAFGQLGDARWAGSVAAWMDDPTDDKTRLAAVKALGQLSPNFGDYELNLARRINPAEEKSRDVQDSRLARPDRPVPQGVDEQAGPLGDAPEGPAGPPAGRAPAGAQQPEPRRPAAGSGREGQPDRRPERQRRAAAVQGRDRRLPPGVRLTPTPRRTRLSFVPPASG